MIYPKLSTLATGTKIRYYPVWRVSVKVYLYGDPYDENDLVEEAPPVLVTTPSEARDIASRYVSRFHALYSPSLCSIVASVTEEPVIAEILREGGPETRGVVHAVYADTRIPHRDSRCPSIILSELVEFKDEA